MLEIGAAAATQGASALWLAEHGAAAVVSVDSDAEALARWLEDWLVDHVSSTDGAMARFLLAGKASAHRAQGQRSGS